ncbi:hypothetical protein ABBQ38_005985 [Trebouxia sp. C0009 RCD-2024]
MDSSRVLVLQNRLDAARDKLQAELDKGAARDKSLVTSYEKSIEELKVELSMHTPTVGARLHVQEGTLVRDDQHLPSFLVPQD